MKTDNNFDLRKFLAENKQTKDSKLVSELPNANLELKNVAKQLYSGFKKMGADVELAANKVFLNQAPSGNLDHKNVWLYMDLMGNFLQVQLVGDKAIGFADKIKKDFSRFKFQDKPDSESWDGRTVKSFNILPGATTSEETVDDLGAPKKETSAVKNIDKDLADRGSDFRMINTKDKLGKLLDVIVNQLDPKFRESSAFKMGVREFFAKHR